MQTIRQQRQRKTKSGIASTFSGLVYCADCGEKLYYGATNNGKREGAFFDCSVHWKHKRKCGIHFIRESVLERMVLKHIQLVMGYILRYHQHFISVMETTAPVEIGKKDAVKP
ncbi:MAG: zinc ribbon domain-containing protein [Oscillospiraceae bacterium]